MHTSRKIASFLLILTVVTRLVFAVGCDEKEVPGSTPRITNHGVGPGYEGFCLTCHGPGNGPDEFPPDHAGRTNDICLTCHRP